jgi:hypothetical protein
MALRRVELFAQSSILPFFLQTRLLLVIPPHRFGFSLAFHCLALRLLPPRSARMQRYAHRFHERCRERRRWRPGLLAVVEVEQLHLVKHTHAVDTLQHVNAGRRIAECLLGPLLEVADAAEQVNESGCGLLIGVG